MCFAFIIKGANRTKGQRGTVGERGIMGGSARYVRPFTIQT